MTFKKIVLVCSESIMEKERYIPEVTHWIKIRSFVSRNYYVGSDKLMQSDITVRIMYKQLSEQGVEVSLLVINYMRDVDIIM